MKPVRNTSELKVELLVNGAQWKHVASLDYSGPNDEVYTVGLDQLDDVKISFGNGQRGRKPPTGAIIQATYTHGKGNEGTIGTTIALTWTSGSFRENEVVEVIIEPLTDGINFRTCRGAQISYKWKWIAILCRKLKRSS